MATAAVHAYAEEVASHVKEELEERLSRMTTEPEAMGSPREVARRMVAAVPVPSRWDELLGPFYGTEQVAKLLGGVTRQAVAERRKRRTFLALTTADGVLVYPAFQFERDRVLPGLAKVLQCFGDGAEEWTLAGWLVSPSRSLGGRSPVEWLRDGREQDPLLALAREAAGRFAR